ncbi:uncharacterized protein LOC121733579 [Aricia agestis]|uniref:uncharacterized protein LOC121733579 n=1 Tax=Aricia agestis TaxID=91739 RepID=UPI001C206898|nr:uncharacterized protein LOC121733579 [Aricia agestis]
MSLFGEIVEPTSRTTWEDWDDDFAQNPFNTQLEWLTPLESNGNIKTTFILEGRYLSNCIKQAQELAEPISSIDSVNLKLYKLKTDNVLVCTIQDYDLLQSSDIVEALRPVVSKSNNVISLLTKPLPDYQSTSLDSSMCIVRKLSTTTAQDNQFNFKNLEQPNIISGVSAGVTFLREHLNLPATVLVYYVDFSNDYVEEINCQLEKLKLIETSKRIHNNILSSNLYI